MMERTEYLAAIAAGRDQLVAAATAAGLSRAVPTCSRWRVADLVIHAGNVHDWARDVVTTGVEQPQRFDVRPDHVADRDLPSWYAGRADELLEALSSPELPADRPTWSFGPPATVAFWLRRQAHEVTIHALDARLASGAPVGEVVGSLDPQWSSDGIDEVLSVMLERVAMFVPRPALAGRLGLVAEDTRQHWVLEPDGQIASGATLSGTAARLSGPAASLFALLWRRIRLGRDDSRLGLEVTGNASVVDALFAARLTP